MSRNIENFNEYFSDKDILLDYENVNRKEIEIISKKLDDVNLRSKFNISVGFARNGQTREYDIGDILAVEDYINEIFTIEKEEIKRLEQIKNELDEFYKKDSSKLVLSIYPYETHYNPNNGQILIGLKEQIIDFLILSRHCGLNNITGKQAISYLSFLLYHEYYHYLFDELKLGDGNLIDRELLTKDEIYFKITSKYKNEKMAWKFAKAWIRDSLDEKVLNAIINVSMFSYGRDSIKALEQLNYPFSDFVNVMGTVLVIKH